MQVKPKLSLNNSPTNCEEGSLVFAKNVKVDTDGSIVPDYGYDAVTVVSNVHKGTIVGHIVGLDNTIYFFFADNVIVEYNELNKSANKINCAWKYEAGAEIDGCITTNVSGEKILTIAQYKENGNTPLQHINLKYCATADDNSVYNQAPNIPIVNLILNTTYAKTIPNGVYVFYIRWEIRDKVYTPWMLCSHPVFAGVNTRIDTIQGGVKYIDTKRDSAKSFIFDLNVLKDDANIARLNTYKKFQLGFVLTHDDATVARSWKVFKTDAIKKITNIDISKTKYTATIYFDYDNVDEVNIDDMQTSIYELYNVRNVTNFKNKLYISNYCESDFNDKVNLDSLTKAISGINNPDYTKGVSTESNTNSTYNGNVLNFNYTKGYFDTYSDSKQAIRLLFAHDGGYYNAALNWGITKAVKTGETEFEKAVTFDVCWDSSINPDLAVICNINNNIKGFAPFGSLPEGLSSTAGGPTRFVNEIATYNGLWVYGPHKTSGTDNVNKNHPWYNLTVKRQNLDYTTSPLTFMYGSTDSRDINNIAGARYHVFPFNANTPHYRAEQETNAAKVGWPSRDKGIDESARSYIKRNVADEVEGQKYCAIAYMYFTNGATKYYVNFVSNKDDKNYCIDVFTPDPGYLDNAERLNETGIDNINNIKHKLYNYVYNNYLYTNDNNIVGLDESGMLVIKVTDPDTNKTIEIPVNSANVVFKFYEFSTSSPDDVGANDDNNFNVRFDVKLKTTTYEVPITFAPAHTINNSSSFNDDNIQSATLMPYSKYNYYAHLVKADGMITNGMKIGTSTNNSVDVNKIITPKFILGDVSKINKDYVGWFVSIENIGKKIAECFNIIYANGKNYASCLEVDAMLYNLNNNIKIIDNTGAIVTTEARYASCGISNPIEAFGNCGFVYWSGDDCSGKQLYIEIDNDESDKDVHDLIKCTPYYPLVAGTYPVSGTDLFTGSYLCYVKKPTYRLGLNTYVAGKDVYKVNRTNGLSLTDFESYIQMQSSNTVTIHSNFNLNYLSLTTDIEDQIFTIGSASTGYKQAAKVINSAQLSFIYELKSMYKDFTNQVFRSYTEYSRTQFDNTVRVSNVLSDETFNNSVYTFAPSDYYNVPTNRGIIVKLIAISTYIYVHTTGALYRFDGSETITSNDKTIQLKESEPFVNGITAILDSQYGYAGLTDKHSAVATFSDYYFYDSVSNHIFGFAGQGGIKIIDTSIWELLKYYKPTTCNVISDEINNRIMFDFGWADNEGSHNFCISYNTLTNTFVSLHDLSLNNAFNSRRNCYSYKKNLVSLFGGNTDMTKHYGDDAKSDCYIKDLCSTSKRTDTGYVVDIVLFPDNGVNVINSVHYIARLLKTFADKLRNYIRPIGYDRTNPVNNLFVWSDSAESNVVDSNNDASVLNSYKGFGYDKGQWTVNYLRNILNADNIYNYPDNYQVGKTDDKGNVTQVHRSLISDQNSLVYGRYFVISLMFNDKPFKLESIDINKEIY